MALLLLAVSRLIQIERIHLMNIYMYIYYILLLFTNRSLYFYYLSISTMFPFPSLLDLSFPHFRFRVSLFQFPCYIGFQS